MPLFQIFLRSLTIRAFNGDVKALDFSSVLQEKLFETGDRTCL